LNLEEINYHTIDKEIKVCLNFIKKFELHLMNTKFLIRTDS
jgi:hypothetical protein